MVPVLRFVGTVTDQTSAAIPNATINVSNLATRLKFHATSDGAEGFEISVFDWSIRHPPQTSMRKYL